MQIGINGYEEGKDKEALFNVTYYFNSLGHEILCDITKYPFTDTYLALRFWSSINKGAASTVFVPFSAMLLFISPNPPISELKLI